MKMRELESRTGVSREVIRIMLREGLLPEPVRPARNAAEYDEAHVRGIAAVRELQTASRMTLKEIKKALDAGGLQRVRATGSTAHLDALLAGLFDLEAAPPVALATLELRAPAARRDAEAFQKLGMLDIIEGGGDKGPVLSVVDARLVDIWAAIREAGFDEAAGFPPDNIGFYLKAAREVAAREVEVFLGNNQRKIEDEEAARMLHLALPLMTEFFSMLRIKCFMKSLSTHLAQNG